MAPYTRGRGRGSSPGPEPRVSIATIEMSRAGPEGIAPGTWRCRACGTPNPRASYPTHCLGCGRPRPAALAPGAAVVRPSGAVRFQVALALGIVCWASALALLAVLTLLRWGGDRWWPATVLLYGPRWPWAASLVGLVPATAWLRPRSLPALLGAGRVALGPVMGFRVPWRAWLVGGPEHAPELRLLICNVHVDKRDPSALAALIRAVAPEVVALQEWPQGWDSASVFPGSGWQTHVEGALCPGSRYPIRAVERLGREDLGWNAAVVRYRLVGHRGEFLEHNLHRESPREGLEAVLNQSRPLWGPGSPRQHHPAAGPRRRRLSPGQGSRVPDAGRGRFQPGH